MKILFLAFLFVGQIVYLMPTASAEKSSTPGFYTSVGYGSGDSNIRLNDLVADDQCQAESCRLSGDDIDTFNFHLGYRWNPYLSAELGYVDFQEVFFFRGTIDSNLTEIT